MADSVLKTNCRTCGLRTRHKILFSLEKKGDADFYNELDTWQTLECLGCETVGFRHRYDDFEKVKESLSGKATHEIKINLFPKTVIGHRKLQYLYAVPAVIRKVYTQTLASYAGDASIIASIGLRATIEAVCNHLKISGTSLEKRIDLLFKNGSISSSDKKRLHAIRFLGNDAAHEILEPKETELRVAFEIIEHLINSVFILEYRAKRLDIPVDTYAEFLSLVEDCAGNSTAQSAESLPSILGRHRRRLGSELLEFETRLGSQITAGEIAFLKLDSVQTIDGKAVQLYLVDHEALTDDIPF